MNAFDVLGDPVRRRLLELLAERELSAGELAEVITTEFGISQPAVSQHLRVLRESGFATSRAEGPRRLYIVQSEAFDEIDTWINGIRRYWEPKLDALATEIARGKRRKASE